MQEFYLYLSGNVPGGFLLLSFLLLSVNIALYYLYKSSKLFEKKQYIRNASRFNISLILIYLLVWIYLQPPALPGRLAFLPWQNGETVDVNIAEYVQIATLGQIDNDYFLHQWDWFYATADKDSLNDPEYRQSLAGRLGIRVFVTGGIEHTSDQVILHTRIVNDGDVETIDLSAGSLLEAVRSLVTYLIEEPELATSSAFPAYNEDQIIKLTQAKIAFIDGNIQPALDLIEGQGRESDVLKSAALIQKGFKNKPKKVDSDLKNVSLNKFYQQAQAILIPYSRIEQDDAALNTVLARLYMYMGDYETAEVCLKRAMSQNPYDARVYFMMSFLHPSRFAELGFKDRKAVLNYAIRLDPGYATAVVEQANEYYVTGTATPVGYSTLYAIDLLKDFEKLNSRDYSTLSLLGKIYLQSKYTPQARDIFEKLNKLYPESAENCYNLGICYYHLKEFDQAEKQFLRAIDLNDDDDSFLYLGAIYRTQGDDQKALKYFRERIRRKSGTDDHYAKEAMRQVRIILSQQYQDSVKVEDNENTHPASQ